jgi:hypothetical protein
MRGKSEGKKNNGVGGKKRIGGGKEANQHCV